jgi:RNA-directed DNA polymerase
MNSVTRFITQKLRLKVNEAKSAVARPQQQKFLGFSFSDGPGDQAHHCAKGSGSLQAPNTRNYPTGAKGVSIEETIAELAPIYAGPAWLFRILRNTRSAGLPHSLDPRLRLRAAMWRQWKTPRRRLEALLALGVYPRLGPQYCW